MARVKSGSMKGMIYLFMVLVIGLPIALYLIKQIFGISLEGFACKNAGYPRDYYNHREGFTGAPTNFSSSLSVPSIPEKYKMKEFGSKFLSCRSPDGSSSCPEGTFCNSLKSECTPVSVKGFGNVTGYYN
jgi:hypothetical protein